MHGLIAASKKACYGKDPQPPMMWVQDNGPVHPEGELGHFFLASNCRRVAESRDQVGAAGSLEGM